MNRRAEIHPRILGQPHGRRHLPVRASRDDVRERTSRDWPRADPLVHRPSPSPPLPSDQFDFSGYLLAAVTFLAPAHRLRAGGHVRVTLRTGIMPRRLGVRWPMGRFWFWASPSPAWRPEPGAHRPPRACATARRPPVSFPYRAPCRRQWHPSGRACRSLLSCKRW